MDYFPREWDEEEWPVDEPRFDIKDCAVIAGWTVLTVVGFASILLAWLVWAVS